MAHKKLDTIHRFQLLDHKIYCSTLNPDKSTPTPLVVPYQEAFPLNEINNYILHARTNPNTEFKLNNNLSGTLTNGATAFSVGNFMTMNTLYYTANTYNPETINYVVKAGDQYSWDCAFSVKVCYKSCASCNDPAIATPSVDNHYCYVCRSPYAKLKSKTSQCLAKNVTHDKLYLNVTDDSFMECGVSCQTCIEGPAKCLTCALTEFYYYKENEPFNCYEKTTFLAANPTYYFNVTGDQPRLRACSIECGTCSVGPQPGDQHCDTCHPDYHYIYLTQCYTVCPLPSVPYLTTDQCVVPPTQDEILELIKDPAYLEQNISFVYDNLDTVINEDESSYTIYSTADGAKPEWENEHLPKINLGECEVTLKEYYGLSMSDPLMIYLKNTPNNTNIISTAEYKVYSKDFVELDTSICKTGLMISIPINPENPLYQEAKGFQEIGIDVYLPKDQFFNYICTPFTSPEGNDIPRKDRIDNYLQDNSTLCKPGCTFQTVNYDSAYDNCECDNVFIEENAFESLKNSMIDSLLNGNWEVILCLKLVFNQMIIPNNIGSWFVMGIIICMIANMFYFLCTGTKPLSTHCQNIYKKAVDEKVKAKSLSIKVMSPTEEGQTDIATITDGNTVYKHQLVYSIRCTTKNLITNAIPNVNVIKIHPQKKTEVISINTLVDEKKPVDNIDPKDKPDQEPIKTNHTAEEYKDMELDELIDKDHRNVIQHFWGFNQLCHPLLNTFFTMSKRVLRSVKIATFLIGFAVDFTLSAFFYSDNYISHNNTSDTNNFWYNLPISLYTCLLGLVFIYH